LTFIYAEIVADTPLNLFFVNTANCLHKLYIKGIGMYVLSMHNLVRVILFICGLINEATYYIASNYMVINL
jgi:hypothetical protein